jgi:hypothetical protein
MAAVEILRDNHYALASDGCRVEAIGCRRIRVGIEAQIKVTVAGETKWLDVVKLAVAKDRERFVADLRQRGHELDEHALIILNNAADQSLPRGAEDSGTDTLPGKQFEHSNTSPQVECSLAVDALLRDSNLIQRVFEGIRSMGYVGDPRPAVLVYVALTSRLLPRAINIAIVAPPGAGKNHTVDVARALVPPDAVYLERAGSERALIYTDESFTHRVVIFAEADSIPDEGPAASAIRSLASDNILSYDVVEQNKKSGKWETRRIEKPGPTGLITTSTKSLQNQLGTRVLEITIPDDETQTQLVMAAQARAVSGMIGGVSPDIQVLIEAQQWLAGRPIDVVVPFARVLSKLVPAKAVRMRRDFRQLLICIQAIALLHQMQRERTPNGDVIATLGDYEIARDLLASVFDTITAEGLTPAIRTTVEAVHDGETITNAQLGNRLDLSASTVSWRVQKAVRRGWLRNLEMRRGHPAQLQRGNPLPDEATALPTVDQVRQAFESIRPPFESASNTATSDETTTSVDPFECSNDFREGETNDEADKTWVAADNGEVDDPCAQQALR